MANSDPLRNAEVAPDLLIHLSPARTRLMTFQPGINTASLPESVFVNAIELRLDTMEVDPKAETPSGKAAWTSFVRVALNFPHLEVDKLVQLDQLVLIRYGSYCSHILPAEDVQEHPGSLQASQHSVP